MGGMAVLQTRAPGATQVVVPTQFFESDQWVELYDSCGQGSESTLPSWRSDRREVPKGCPSAGLRAWRLPNVPFAFEAQPTWRGLALAGSGRKWHTVGLLRDLF